MPMFYKVPQQGKYRPQPKDIKSTGLVILCENITEVNPPGITQQSEFTYYTWLETRYNIAEYLAVVEKENTQLWDTVEHLLKITGQIPTEEATPLPAPIQ